MVSFREYIQNEGIELSKSSNTYTFDFKNDSENSIVKLVLSNISKIEKYDVDTYFGYTFEKDINKSLKLDFINSIKYFGTKVSESDVDKFIGNAIRLLNKKVNLSLFKTIVYPQSSSKLNIKTIERIMDMSLGGNFITFELIKELPKNIEFDYERYIEFLRIKGVKEQDIEKSCTAVKNMMDSIHKLEYFKIGKNTKAKYRGFLKNFYKFKSDEDRKAYEKLQNENVIIIDDISTTHSTMRYVLNALRTINNSNNLVVFCLISNQ